MAPAAQPIETGTATVGSVTLRRVEIAPEPDIIVPILIAAKAGAAQSPAVLVVSSSKLDTVSWLPVAELINRDTLVCLADLRGLGESAAEDFEIATDLWMLGRTLQGEWIADIRSVVRYVRSLPGVKRLCLVGREPMGELVLLAAACIPNVDAVVAETPLGSYKDLVSHKVRRPASIYLPRVLLNFDIPEVVAAIAPRKAALVNPVDGNGVPLDAERAAQLASHPVYARLGAPGALTVVQGAALDANLISKTVTP